MIIPLAISLNPELLKDVVKEGDSVAVFGGSHSTVLIIQNLVELGVKVINFYRSKLLYAVYHEGFIEYDNIGLKGKAAVWAKENMEPDTMHKNIKRV